MLSALDLRPSALRLVVVAAQAATIVMTWPLWQVRAELPLLPALSLPPIAFGPWLLASLALAVVRPALGAVAHAAVLVLAMLADQTREQPQFLSLAVLLFASLPGHRARAVGVLHLAALWFWSGLGKLTSERFLTIGGAWLLDPHGIDAVGGASATGIALGAGLGLAELALGVLVLVPRTRPLAAALGVALHTGALLFLALGRDWNAAVWPWNTALAASSWLLLRGADGGLRALLASGVAVRIAALAFVVLPIGFHVGLVDAPLAQQVYTANACHGLVLRADGRTETIGEMPCVGVPLPPVPRIVHAWFAATARPGDRLLLVDDRPLAGLARARESIVHARREP